MNNSYKIFHKTELVIKRYSVRRRDGQVTTVSLSGKSLGMGSSVLKSASSGNAAGSVPRFSGVSVKSTAGLWTIIGACC